jgi:hypothetical protein
MASAGAVTITNNYESKIMTARADTILSLDLISPDSIADALDAARTRVRLDQPTAPITVSPLPSPYPAMDSAAVVSYVLGRIDCPGRAEGTRHPTAPEPEDHRAFRCLRADTSGTPIANAQAKR